jgi:hypothetical protein
MGLNEEEMGSLPFRYRIVIFIAGALNSVINRMFKFSLVVSVMLIGLMLTVPVAGVWTMFVLAYYLPQPLGAILIWVIILSLIALAAAVDYVRSN